MAESSTPEEMLSSSESSGEVPVHMLAHNLILYVTDSRVLRVEFTNCQSWPHETSWTCIPTPNQHYRGLFLDNPKLRPQLSKLKEKLESRGEHLTSIHSGSLIFVFGHDTEFEAIKQAARLSEIKNAILLFLQEISSQVKDIRMEADIRESKRTAKRQKHQKECGQIITGMDGDSTAIHSNVSGIQNIHEMRQGNIHVGGDVFYLSYDDGKHETIWHCLPLPNRHISQVLREACRQLGSSIREFCCATLRRVAGKSLIFSFAHTTREDAIDMIVKHKRVKEVFLDFVQKLDPSIKDIRIEVELRELCVSEEQTTQTAGNNCSCTCSCK
ncbi:uncharacterized protein LOC124149273 [Haliotis rufescens]|uniref:uncharacterized protein LOC124149273 n=1 Tax=Haliotis rufescens TaxID=6454 RepID=UPI00201F48D5|nr:uncharacterized protein LOC124149273 [Haliotis rufescens]